MTDRQCSAWLVDYTGRRPRDYRCENEATVEVVDSYGSPFRICDEHWSDPAFHELWGGRLRRTDGRQD